MIDDTGYTGIEKREEHQNRDVEWMTAERLQKNYTYQTHSRYGLHCEWR
ncbi:hypothetical protein [Gynuella sp.]